MINLSFSTKIIKKNQKRAIFEIEPLYPGYGVTIGNSLRRVLLSSVEGAAVTQVKIKGAPSEFSNISGIKEDVLEIILNLKKLRLKLLGNEPQKLELKVSGEKDVKAGDIKTPPQVEIINKDLHIASLTQKNSKLEMEILVERGLGYVPAEKLKKGKAEVGIIYVDAIFTPVLKVAFTVENIMFEERTDYNKLKIEVETDGTITPEEALERSLRVLMDHLISIGESFTKKRGKKEEEKPEKKVEQEEKLKLEDLKLSQRTLNVLENGGIKSIEGLLRRKEDALYQIKGMGDKAIKEIKSKLKRKGLELKQ
jgi:DNA-directed RNA polymerase subunit alpha